LKRAGISLFLASGLLIILGTVLHSVPRINDVVSGQPRPMKAIANVFAQALADKTGREFPVIVGGDEPHPCEDMHNSDLTDYDEVYYVFTYSEKLRSVCFTGYAAVSGPTPTNTVVISQTSGENYGPALTRPVRVTPISHSLRVFTNEFLSLLDWHKEMKPENKTITASHHYFSTTANQTNEDLTLNLYALRAEAAKRHQAVNRGLLWGMSLLSGVSILSAGMVWLQFRRFRQHCLVHGLGLNLRTYLHEDLTSMSDRAQKAYLLQQQHLSEAQRAENVLRRSKEETRTKLRGFLDLVPDVQQRSSIRECLDRDDLEEMTPMLHELQYAAGQKTPQERVALLLESLKPYCTDEEFENCRTEALQYLEQLGFRQARDFVVRTHNEFRARVREAVQDDVQEDSEDRVQESGSAKGS